MPARTIDRVRGMNNLWPVFPVAVGAYVEFDKDGRWYRLKHEVEGMWVIHQRGVGADDFQLDISNRNHGPMDVEGRGHGGPMTALGASEGILFNKLF